MNEQDTTNGGGGEARFASKGQVWMCAACGKLAKDRYSDDGGWDESCMLNSYLVDEANPVLDMEKVAADRAAMEVRHKEQWAKLLADLSNPDPGDIDPELLALAQLAIERRAGQVK